MAQVSGGAAYSGYKKLDNSISQGLQHWGDIKAEENAAKKLADERAGIRKAASDAAFEKSLEGDYKFEMSKNDTLNDILINYSESASNLATEEGNLAIKAKNEGRMDEARQHKQNNKAIQRSFDNIKTLSPKVSAQIDWYITKKDKILLTDYRNKMYDAVFKNNYLLKPTRDGKLKMIIGLDRDNDGKISKEEREAGNKYLRDGFKTKGFNFQEIKPTDFANGGYQSYLNVPILEKDGLLDQLTSSVGITTIDKNDPSGNYKLTTTSVTPDKYAQLKQQAQVIMSDPENQANIMSKLNILDKNGYIKKTYLKGDTSEDRYSKEDIDRGVDYLLESAKTKFGFKQTQTTNRLTIKDKKEQKRKDRALGYSRLTETSRHNKEMEGISKTKAKEKAKNAINGDKEKIKELNMYAWKLASEIADLPEKKQNDTEVKKILDREGIKMTTDWQLWFQDNKFDVGSGKNKTWSVSQKDKHGLAESISKVLGVDYDRKAVVLEKEKKLDAASNGELDTSKMTPQEKLDYYRKKKIKK